MSEFVFMLKMDGCGHCTVTLERAKQIKAEKGKKRRVFHANTAKYHSLCKNHQIEDELRVFLDNRTSKRKVLDVSAFPTLFLVDSKTGNIIRTVVGAPNLKDLNALINAK